MFCGKCGSGVPEGTKYCPNCGNPLEITDDKNTDVQQPVSHAQTDSAENSVQETPVRKKSRKGLIITVVVIAVLLFVVLPIVAIVIAPVLFRYTVNDANQKKCSGNMRLIQFNLASYIQTGNGGFEFTDEKEIDLDSFSFRSMFQDGNIPTCPSDDNNTPYDIEIFRSEDGELSFSVKCVNPECANYGQIIGTDSLDSDFQDDEYDDDWAEDNFDEEDSDSIDENEEDVDLTDENEEDFDLTEESEDSFPEEFDENW